MVNFMHIYHRLLSCTHHSFVTVYCSQLIPRYCKTKTMPLLLHYIFNACTCMPISRNDDHEVHRVRRDNPNGAIIYPESFMLATGPYGSSGKYVASGQFFNNYPVYTGPNGSTYWKIYVRKAGHWVLNGNVHEDWHGTVAYMHSLFSPNF